MAFVGSFAIGRPKVMRSRAVSRRHVVRLSETSKGASLSAEAIATLQKQKENPLFNASGIGGVWGTAEAEKRFLSDEELGSISDGDQSQIASTMRDQVNDIVALSRKELLKEFPNITEPGGALYPQMRSDACWRDFWHFTRVASYGASLGTEDFLSSDGIQAMYGVYKELEVPLDAMMYGVNQLKEKTKTYASSDGQVELVEQSFTVILKALEGYFP